jgi:hypothetical protein
VLFVKQNNPVKTTVQNLKMPWLLAGLLLLPALTRAQTAVQSWAQRYNGLSTGNRRAKALAVDASNNVVVTGYAVDNGGYSYYATIKYSGAGTPLWTNLYNRPGNTADQAQAIAVDSTNNVIVTGCSVGSLGTYDYATIKYSSGGTPSWTNRYDGPGGGEDRATAVAVDGSGNVIVTGYSTGTGFNYDYATIKYAGATGAPIWTNRYNGPGNGDDKAAAVAVDSGGNVFVTGSSAGAAGLDYATIKYASAGAPAWTNRYNGPLNSDDIATALVVDGGSNVIVTGYSPGSGGYTNYLTIKYSNAGGAIWTNRYNGLGYGLNAATAVAVDSSSNVVVTGYSLGAAGFDYATIKYSGAGAPTWTNRYSGAALQNDFATAVAVDGGGNAFVTGYATVSGVYYAYATLGYASNGVPLWTNYYYGPGTGENEASAVAVDHSGNVIVTGYSLGGGSAYDYATIKYLLHVPSPVMTGLKLTNGTFQLRVANVLQPGTLVIEARTNLAPSQVLWSPIYTNTTPTNVLFYTDPKASNYLRRFYRAFQHP